MNLPQRLPCGCVSHENLTACSGPVAMPADDYAALRNGKEVLALRLSEAIVLLNQWTQYATDLAIENIRLRDEAKRCEKENL